MLSVEQVSKRFGAREVLTEVSFEIGHGEAFALMGLNGAGKSSLLRCVLNLLVFDSGRIRISGRPHSDSAARAAVFYLAEHFSPPPAVSGHDCLRYVAGLYARAYRPEEACALAAGLDLDPAQLSAPVRQFSKGNVQKLGLTMALLSDCPLLILDEPFSGLDGRALAQLVARLSAARDAGQALLFTTHRLAEAGGLSDRVAVLHDGHLAFCGRPLELAEVGGSATADAGFLRLVDI
jgi:ABC-2 type transport system ATP-binding protein